MHENSDSNRHIYYPIAVSSFPSGIAKMMSDCFLDTSAVCGMEELYIGSMEPNHEILAD